PGVVGQQVLVVEVLHGSSNRQGLAHVDAGVCQDGELRTTDRVDRAGAACVVEVRTDVEHAELGVANELRAPLFHNGLVANHGTDVAPALGQLHAACNSRPELARTTLDGSNDSREAVGAIVLVGQFAGVVEAVGAVERTEGRTVAEEAGIRRVALTEADGAVGLLQLDEALVQDGACTGSNQTAGRVPVEASLNIRTERAPLGLVARINIELEASELAEAVVVQVAVAVDPVGIVVVHLVAHVATDAQAGLGARDVEETSAV